MTSNEIRTKINNLVDKHTDNANKVISRLNRNVKLLVNRPKVVFFTKGTRAGWCRYMTNEIGFNEVIARDNWNKFEETIIHEIGHLVVWYNFPNAKQHHGPEFRWVMRAMGGRGSTKHSYDVSSIKKIQKPRKEQKRYVYTCVCSEHKLSGIRHSKVKSGKANYRCRKCQELLRYANRFYN